MSFLVEYEDKLIAFGAKWAAVPKGRGEKARASSIGAEFDAAYRIRTVVGDEVRYGFVEKSGRLAEFKTGKGKLVSAAALFVAKMPTDQASILIQIFESKKKAIIIAVLNGVLHTDIVVSLGNNMELPDGDIDEDGRVKIDSDNAYARIRDRVDEIFNETGAQFVPYGNCYFLFDQSKEMTIADLCGSDITAGVMSPYYDSRKLRNVFIFIVVLTAILFGNQYYEKYKKKQALLAAQADQVDPMELYRNNVEEILRTARFDGNMALHAFQETLDTRPLEIGGWVLQSVTCKKTGVCEELWSAEGGTNDSFVQNNTLGKAVFMPDLVTIRNYYSVKSGPRSLLWGFVPKAETFWAESSTLFQKLSQSGIQVQVSGDPSVDFALTAGLTEKALPKGEALARGGVNIQGPVGFYSEVLSRLPTSVSVDQISLSVAEGVADSKFKIQGFYYAKK